ncbi:HNH endonuclease signature motif containing protein [Calidifontibacter terrae]
MKHGRNTDPEAPIRAAKEFLRNVLHEDGVAEAVDAATSPTLLPSIDPITRHLLIMELLQASLYDRLKNPDPFDEDTGDDYWSPAPIPALMHAALDGRAAGELVGADDLDSDAARVDGAGVFGASGDDRSGVAQWARYEQATVSAHRIMQISGAIRTLAAARFAAYDPPAGTPAMAPSDFIEHPADHISPWADSYLGPALGLGPYQAARLIEEAAWMRTRTPNLLDEVAHQGPRPLGDNDENGDHTVAASQSRRCRAKARNVTGRAAAAPINLDTVAAIARELQDAHPDTCETVQDAVLRRGIHHTTRREAGRSTRTLVTKHEAAAARSTAKKTTAQKEGVWLDPIPDPGLSLLTAILDTERATALMAAIEEHAHNLHTHAGAVDSNSRDRADDSDRLLGQHRTDALFELAMRNVTLHANLDIVVPSRDSGCHEDNGDEGGHAYDRDETGHEDSAGQPRTEPRVEAGLPAEFRSTPELASSLSQPDALAFHHTGALSLGALTRLLTALPGTKVRVRVRTLDDFTKDTSTNRRTSSSSDVAAYRPRESLRDKVRARDRTCRHPGCSRPARYTDIDHVTPWPAGRTTLANLHCLCRRHHRAKHAAWRITLHPNGIETWTTPTGRSYTSRPGLFDDLAHMNFPDLT